MKSTELLKILEDTGALLKGHFLLTSGRHSDKYIEKFRVLENPDSLDKVCRAMAATADDKSVDLVLGAAVGGHPDCRRRRKTPGCAAYLYRAGRW